MSAFDKVLLSIQGHQPNGHAELNRQNRVSLTKAKREIEKLLKGRL